MNKFFYAKLAATNIRKNARVYVPYLLTCIFTVAAFYMIYALSLNPGIDDMTFGGGSLRVCLGLGVWVVSLFAYIFIFYTNSFLMKRRKKEIGLFNVLGMGKGHLSRMIFYETVYIALISLSVGLGFGIILDKAAFLVLAKLMTQEVPLGFYVSMDAIRNTLLIFGILFLLIFLNSLRQIHLTNPIELLRGGQTGEKEPKARWLLALIGVALLGSGYWLAISITNPVQAFMLFFVAVILVILGTYCLFTAGSIAILKILRKNKRFYYQARHFISISGMIYRMKQNAVGLANICVLSTMVLVMISSTFSMYIGMEDMIAKTYPRDFEVRVRCDSSVLGESLEKVVGEILEEEGVTAQDVLSYTYLNTYSQKINGVYEIAPEKLSGMTTSDYYTFTFITLDEYNRLMGTSKALNDGEVLLYVGQNSYQGNDFPLGEKKFTIKEKVSAFPENGASAATISTKYGVVVKDFDALMEIEKMQHWRLQGGESYDPDIECTYGFNLDTNEQTEAAVNEKLLYSFEQIRDEAAKSGGNITMLSTNWIQEQRNMMMGIVGGLLFVGVFLGALFIMATILIIYYKQISEGYDDKERFQIMEKVGMDQREIRRTIRSQVLTVFFLPLMMAGVHTAFAFPMISRILVGMALQNTQLYIICTVISFLIFGVLYGLIYSLTARIYYKIVS